MNEDEISLLAQIVRALTQIVRQLQEMNETLDAMLPDQSEMGK